MGKKSRQKKEQKLVYKFDPKFKEEVEAHEKEMEKLKEESPKDWLSVHYQVCKQCTAFKKCEGCTFTLCSICEFATSDYCKVCNERSSKDNLEIMRNIIGELTNGSDKSN